MLETETSKILQLIMNVTLATRLHRLQQSLHGRGESTREQSKCTSRVHLGQEDDRWKS